MARTRTARLAWNRGLVSRLGLARADIQRLAFAAETQVNWIPRVLGSMSIRPGLKFLASTRSNLASRSIPFVFSTNDVARIELTNQKMRVFVDDEVIERVSVSTAVTNGDFTTDLTGWTDNDEAGATSSWGAAGVMALAGNGTAAAIRDQEVTVAAGDQNVEHALRIIVTVGPVFLRVGSTLGDDDYISETSLDTGEHSLAFTPTGNFHIRFLSRSKRPMAITSCNVEAAGDMEITTPWTTDDLDLVRAGLESQSGDIIFVACEGFQQRKIERRATRSWSVVRYDADDGPFRAPNTGPITISSSNLTGATTLTASAPLFKTTHAPTHNNPTHDVRTDNDGALFRITSNGQQVTASITAENQFTNAIIVEGVGNQRIFTVTVDEDAAGAATFTLQRSLESDSGPWTDVQQFTADVVTPFDDGLDNQIAFYRLGVKTGDFTSGTHSVSLAYTVGSIDGIVRITGVSSSTVASGHILRDLGGTDATDDWAEGEWSDRRGWPTSGTFYEGRLCWAGKNGVWLSVSDGFFSFDETVEGDSGPIARTVGSGPVDVINWILPLQRLILGAEGAEHSCRASSLDEILTPSNFNIKPASSQGSSDVQALKVDNNGFFIHRGGSRVFELAVDPSAIDYGSSDVTALVPEIGEPSIVRMAVQRLPDTRLHAVRSDGTAGVLVYDKVEQVLCWLEVTSTGASGLIEDVCVLPGTIEDQVYYQVKRTINAATVRYHEKWALESECRPNAAGVLTTCKLADSHIVVTNSPASTTVSGLTHLEGEQVVVWADGSDVGTDSDGNLIHTVSGGEITLTTAASSIVVGLPYSASWKSAKLVELMANPNGSLTDEQRITGLSLILADVHAKGLKYGRNLTESQMDDLAGVGQDGASVDADEIRRSYVTPKMTFPGDYSQDARLCLLAKAPRPCTVLAAIADVEQHG